MDIVIFGTEKRADEAYAIISCLDGYNVVAFSDNDERRWNKKKNGLDIIPPKDIKCRYAMATVVIASAYFCEIGMQLSENGLVPLGGYLDSVDQMIGRLSDDERTALSDKVLRNTDFINLEYKEIEFTDICSETGKTYLVICHNGYRTNDDPRCSFVHRRLLQYQKQGIDIEVFGFVQESSLEIYEYQGVKVYQGGITELQKLLMAKKYEKLLIHFISKEIMYAVWKAGKTELPMIVWCHGYEVMPWTRCWFNFTSEDIKLNKTHMDKSDAERRKFLRSCFEKENIHFVFVSRWQRNRVRKYIGMLPKNHSLIHNFIDCEFYEAPDKRAQDRLCILSVKKHVNRTYANDLTAKAIMELSEKSYFTQLKFELYGDGELFEENFGELMRQNFPNVHIHKKLLSQDEMKDLFKENGVFLSPTRMDCHEVTASEAMAAGMAVITCNIGPMREFMDEECASLFEADNYFMMAEEIEYLYMHPEEFLQMGRNAAKRAKQQCGYEATIKREIELILEAYEGGEDKL